MEHNFREEQQRKKKKGRAALVLGICLGAVLLVIGITAAVLLSHKPSVDPNPQFTTDPKVTEGTGGTAETTAATVPVGTDPEGGYTRKDGFYTFLIAGTDRISMSTDVLMLASLDTTTGQIQIVQIPRDTFISKEVGGYKSINRVNAIFAAEYNKRVNEGMRVKDARKEAMQALCDKLSAALCVNIDRYVLLSTAAFRSVIDAVGGIDYNVPCDMDYEDPEQELYIHLKAGYQHLDGDKCEQLIRNRSGYAGGDIERVSLRGDFMLAAFGQVRAKITLSNMLELIGPLSETLETSMSTADIISYVRMVYAIDSSHIAVRTISGSTVWNPVTQSWSPYYCLNKNGALADINECLNAFVEDIKPDIFDRNGLFTDAKNTANQYIDDYYSS